MDTTHHNEGSFMYYRDYTKEKEGDVDTAIQRNHKTEGALAGKIAGQLRGRGGRLRGKNGARENNKARGGRMAR